MGGMVDCSNHYDEFVWYSDIKQLKPAFLDKRELYINLARMDYNRTKSNFVYTSWNKPIGTFISRFYRSGYIHYVYHSDIKDLVDAWFFYYPIPDFYWIAK